MQRISIFLGVILACAVSSGSVNQNIEIKNHRLHVGSHAEPFLFGAELQYFRLRGGHGKNIPAEKVYRLWDKALRHMREAGMNALSFYIPWDFHEYREGHFDFTGTADEDQDGLPDYPSRNVVYFIQLARQHGFSRIMVRPGPYINAEWGFLGFGAIPLWFHEKYPESHMHNAEGLRTKLYDYHNEDLLRLTRKWFQAVYDQVLKANLGADSPIVFLQIDNETNFMWQSLYNHDYGPGAVKRYREYLRHKYSDLEKVNQDHGRSYQSWEEISPPIQAGKNTTEDADWYRFNDNSIFEYLKILRTMWEDIGIREPQVLFSLAESYNATENGLLPNFQLRSWPGKTGMMTLNLYPKTYESGALLNLPFKADLDAKSMIQANKFYIGNQEWLLGPEIQGGWWKGIGISEAARRQTYLTTIGHGLKALFVYYFTEGENWQHDWAYQQIQPLYHQLRVTLGLEQTPLDQLPDFFWERLKAKVDAELVVGFDPKAILAGDPNAGADLYFDAPLDNEANPRPHFQILKDLGQKLAAPYGDFLGGAVELSDAVGLFKDIACHAPSRVGQKDNVALNSDWDGGLLGYLLQAGFNPQILHAHLLHPRALSQMKYIFRQDCGINNPELTAAFQDFLVQGGILVNFVEETLFNQIKSDNSLFCEERVSLKLDLHWKICSYGKGYLIQVAEPFYQQVNSDRYAELTNMKEYHDWLEQLIPGSLPKSNISILGGGDRTVAFGRISPSAKGLWLTVKTGQKVSQRIVLRVSSEAIFKSRLDSSSLNIYDIFAGQNLKSRMEKSGDLLIEMDLDPEGTRAIFVNQD